MKMVRITGELAKAAGIDPDAEPMPLDFVLEVLELTMPRFPRVTFADYCDGLGKGENNGTS